MWTLANDPRVPGSDPAGVQSLGQLPRRVRRRRAAGRTSSTSREARRMVSDYVMTAAPSARASAWRTTPSAWRAYGMDSHNIQRYVDSQTGTRATKATCRSAGSRPYPIAYRAIVPRAERVHEPARAGLPVRLAHRLRFDPHGAGVHGAGTVRGHGGLPVAGSGRGGAADRRAGPPGAAVRRQTGAFHYWNPARRDGKVSGCPTDRLMHRLACEFITLFKEHDLAYIPLCTDPGSRLARRRPVPRRRTRS